MMTTFLHDGELNVPTSNLYVNELLLEVREQTGEDWQVIERSFVRPQGLKFWKPKEEVKYYELYKYVGGMGPWQCINFYAPPDRSSINPRVDAGYIITYFYGILGGLRLGLQKGKSDDKVSG